MALTVLVASSVFNIANFVLFDCFLCATVFVLTTDIVGRLNAKSASSTTEENLFPYNPPLLGVGLTCTKRRVFYFVTAIRLAAFVTAFATNFLIDGETKRSTVHKEANITVAGNLTLNETDNNIMQKALRRRSCTNSTKNFEYYGELRTFRNETFCELSETLLQQKIYFDFAYKPHNLTFVRCAKKKLHDDRRYYCGDIKKIIRCRSTAGAPESWSHNCVEQDHREFRCGRPLDQGEDRYKFVCKPFTGFSLRTMTELDCKRYFFSTVFSIHCENGIIGCSKRTKNIDGKGCFATANVDNTAYLCKHLESHEKRKYISLDDELSKEKISLRASCKKAKGADWRLDSWIPHTIARAHSIEVAYDAIYATGSKRMKVPFVVNQPVTKVSMVWIILLVLQIAIIACLVAASCFLKYRGLDKVGNGEKELGRLIAINEIRRNSKGLNREAYNLSGTELHLVHCDGELRTFVK